MIKLIYATYKAVKTAKGVVTAPTGLIKKLIRDFAIKKIIAVVVEDVVKAEQKDIEFLNKKYSFALPSYLEKIGKDELVKFLEELFNDGLTFSGDITGYNAGDIKIKLVNNPDPAANANSKIVEIDLKLGLMKDVKKPNDASSTTQAQPVKLEEVGKVGTALDIKIEVEPVVAISAATPKKPKARVKKVSVTNLPEVSSPASPTKKIVKKIIAKVQDLPQPPAKRAKPKNK